MPLPWPACASALVEEGLEAALRPKPTRPQYARKLDGTAEAHLIALACSPAPAGQARWSLRLLADRLVELDHVGSVSYETIRRPPEKNELQPHLKEYWAIPPEHSAEFVTAMEDVLEIYQRPRDSTHPVICMDETSKQLVGETRIALPAAPGQPQREDYE
jgi:Homeodomain-like domain